MILKSLLRVITSPLKIEYLWPNMCHSNLELLVESRAIDLAKARIGGSIEAQVVCDLFCEFLKDKNAHRSLNKGFHIVYENCLRNIALRADPPLPEHFDTVFGHQYDHPLDSVAITDVESLGIEKTKLNSRPGKIGQVRYLIYGVLLGIRYVVKSLITYAFYGTNEVKAHQTLIATPNYWGVDHFRPFIEAATRKGLWDKHNFFMVMERSGNQDACALAGVSMYPSKMLVPRKSWITYVVKPGIKLITSIWKILFFKKYDPIAAAIAIECLEQANYCQGYWRIIFNVQPKYYFDREEYSTSHILKQLIFSKFGVELVRWPGSIFDSLGQTVSYLSHDIFFEGGNFLANNLHYSWKSNLSFVPIGLIQQDGGMNSQSRMFPQYGKRMKGLLKAGKKMVVFFGTVVIPQQKTFMLESLYLVCQELVKNPDWFLVIKPKKSGEQNDLRKLANSEQRFSQFINNEQIVWLDYQNNGEEICPSGWLVDHMTFGTGNMYSVCGEALSCGKPYFVYFPLKLISKYRLQGYKDGFLFDNKDDYLNKLTVSFKNPKNISIPSLFYQESFNAFNDSFAFERMAITLLSDNFDQIENPK